MAKKCICHFAQPEAVTKLSKHIYIRLLVCILYLS